MIQQRAISVARIGTMPACMGQRKDGTLCSSAVVLDNGYCLAHQDQATFHASSDGPIHWTRQRLEAEIAEHGGPEGLYVVGADLSGEDLSHMDLCGIIFGSWDEESDCWRGSDLRSATLVGADLANAWLMACELQGAHMALATLTGARLWEAKLQGADLTSAQVQGAALKDAQLQGACLWGANLEGADLAGADLQGAFLRDANLQNAELPGTRLARASLRGADLRGVDLSAVGDHGLLDIALYGVRLGDTRLRKEQLGQFIAEEQAGSYLEARHAYLALRRNFEALGDYQAATWAYIRERTTERRCSAPWRARRFYGREQLGDAPAKRIPWYHPQVWWFLARHTAKWLCDWAAEVLCGYGVRPWRVVAAMSIVFALFLAVYWATWSVVRIEHKPGGTLYLPTRELRDLVVFGLGAFTTMAPKALGPRQPWVEYLTGLEALLGIGLTGLLGFVVGNRIRRR